MFRGPFLSAACAANPLEADAMRRYQIEFLFQIGQGDIRIDACDDAANIEQGEGVAEKLVVVQIQAQHFVSETFANVEEITGAAAEIENAQRRRTIEPEILRAFNIDPNPIGNIGKTIDLRIAGAIRIVRAQIRDCRGIER